MSNAYGGIGGVRIVGLDEIKHALDPAAVFAAIERGFARYSGGDVVVPPIGELLFDDPPGDVHIKYGYVRGDDLFVVKIASGFYRNAALGIPPQSGLMMAFRQRTGQLDTILLDEGHLTDVRTAVAGAVAAKYLAPPHIDCIGVIGTGVQARLQVQYLQSVVDCSNVLVWGRSTHSTEAYAEHMRALGYSVAAAASTAAIADRCRFIITATPSREPLIDSLRPGTHLTAVGADTPDKNEVAPHLVMNTDLVVADSIVQCCERGEVHHALGLGFARSRLVELGDIVRGVHGGRSHPQQISIADLTGVAVQDIQITNAVLAALPTSAETA
jgi:ornithine cyclodeaminase